MGTFLLNMKCYGYLFGVIKLIEDTHRDEVFVESNGYVIIRNSLRLVTYKELLAIAREDGIEPYRLTIIDYEMIKKELMKNAT